jgi:hypothetical protein
MKTAWDSPLTWDRLIAASRTLGRRRRILAFLIDGRREYAAPFDPLFAEDAAELIEELWPRLRERGRVAIFIETADSNVFHLCLPPAGKAKSRGTR